MDSLARGEGAGGLKVSSVRFVFNYRLGLRRLGSDVTTYVRCRSFLLRLPGPVQEQRSRWHLIRCVSSVDGDEA
jgi:hypothetical protein